MRFRVVLILWVALLASFPRGARGQEHTWIVLSSDTLDDRIEHQLNVLAAHDQALIRIVTAGSEKTAAVPETGGLLIDLRLEKNADAFLKTLQEGAGTAEVVPNAGLATEGYILDATYPRGAAPDRVQITAGTWRGIHDALSRIPDLLAIAPSNISKDLLPRPQSIKIERNGLTAVIADYPSFPQRGVVEGFYGSPWSPRDRADILRFEGAHGMNVYYYAPKDDPYHRKLWREPYPEEARQQLGDLVAMANRNFVDFCFAISPGLSMTYSSDDDFGALTDKLDSVSKLGVSCFALFLDDVPPDLQNAQDKQQFKTLAQAHVDLTNKLFKYLKGQSALNRLMVTPTVYTNEWGSRDYIQEFGAGVDPGVSIAWTGPRVLSPGISVDQAREWGVYLHRPPLIWDNFPVNDGTPWCRYLGPLVGRDAHLPGVVEGLISNPMIEPQASLIPLQTIADYLWNPSAYDPAQSETHAIVSQYGPDAPRQLAPFLKVYGEYYWDDGNFTQLFRERRTPIDVEKMRGQLAEMTSALDRLRYQRRLEPLLSELAPAIKRTTERLAEVEDDPAYRHLPGGTLQWDENHDVLSAYRVAQSPNLNGDFSKWANGPVYRLDDRSDVVKGTKLWNGPQDLSARVALAWDSSYFYVGVDVTDPDLYQPYFARGIQNGDVFELSLETGFRKNLLAHDPTGDEFALYFSPGNFSDVQPSIFSDEDYLPPRPQPHDYTKEIFTAWKKTDHGYSGDIAIPVNYFEGTKLEAGYELGLGFSVGKVERPSHPTDPDDLERIVMQAKKDHLFHLSTGNPSSYPRLVLKDETP
jgi:hypothetical protein